MLPTCHIVSAPRSNSKSQFTVHTGLVSPRYMSHNWVRNVVSRRISQDPGWNPPFICHLQSFRLTRKGTSRLSPSLHLSQPVKDAPAASHAIMELSYCTFTHTIEYMSRLWTQDAFKLESLHNYKFIMSGPKLGRVVSAKRSERRTRKGSASTSSSARISSRASASIERGRRTGGIERAASPRQCS